MHKMVFSLFFQPREELMECMRVDTNWQAKESESSTLILVSSGFRNCFNAHAQFLHVFVSIFQIFWK